MVLSLWLYSRDYSFTVVCNSWYVSAVTGRQRRHIEPRSTLDDSSKPAVGIGEGAHFGALSAIEV